MGSPAASRLPSYRRQLLLSEFASLKHVKPDGVYVTLTPGDPSWWTGVLFVREGPYAPAVLRFRIHFPAGYPYQPPLVTINADVFHPLLTPLTAIATYSQLRHISGRSTPDETQQPAPPGALNLKHGFPCWYPGSGSALRSETHSPAGELENTTHTQAEDQSEDTKSDESSPAMPSADERPTDPSNVFVVDLLRYMRAAFCDSEFLDTVSFEDAANPSAWYAWRAHRAKTRQSQARSSPTGASQGDASHTGQGPGTPGTSTAAAPSTPDRSLHRRDDSTAGLRSTPVTRPKKPGDWNWEGVWEERAKKAVNASLTESVLYAGAGLKDDEIHFMQADDEEITEMRGEARH